MSAPNLRECPNCHRKDFRLASLEKVETFAPIAITGDTVAEYKAEWEGITEVSWDNSTTVCYLCRDCGAVLPDDYQALLDKLLCITREPGGAA